MARPIERKDKIACYGFFPYERSSGVRLRMEPLRLGVIAIALRGDDNRFQIVVIV